MGMGEPLLNFDNAVKATDLMQDDLGFGISKRRVTLSTAGVVPALYRLREVSEVSLAVSLHAPDDALRDELVPLNRKYPIAELLAACKHYIADKPHRRITWEYVLLDGVNDSEQHARALAALLENIPSKVNLIPFNPFPGTRYRRSEPATIARFQAVLTARGFGADGSRFNGHHPQNPRRRHRRRLRSTGRTGPSSGSSAGTTSATRQLKDVSPCDQQSLPSFYPWRCC